MDWWNTSGRGEQCWWRRREGCKSLLSCLLRIDSLKSSRKETWKGNFINFIKELCRTNNDKFNFLWQNGLAYWNRISGAMETFVCTTGLLRRWQRCQLCFCTSGFWLRRRCGWWSWWRRRDPSPDLSSADFEVPREKSFRRRCSSWQVDDLCSICLEQERYWTSFVTFHQHFRNNRLCRVRSTVDS